MRRREIQEERALASLEGLAGDAAYMADLHDELASTRPAFIGAAVIEIATLRAELSAPQVRGAPLGGRL